MRIETPPSSNIVTTAEEEKKILEILFTDEFNDLVNQVNESYYYWDKVKYLKMPEYIKPEYVWAVDCKRIRNQNGNLKSNSKN